MTAVRTVMLSRGIAHLSVLALVLGLWTPALPRAPFTVEWAEGRLSVTAEEAPLGYVLREVARKAGVRFRGAEALQEPVTMNFSGVPLAEGIRRLLARVDHVIVEQAFPEGEMRPTMILLVGRHVAAGGLSEVGDGVVVAARQRLDRSLADPDPAVRRRAVERLGDLRDEWAFSRLMAGLQDANAEVREGAISALAPYGPKAIDPVVSLLRREAYLAPRLAAVELLGQVGGPELVDLFKIMLNDPDPLVRRAAVEGLTQAGGRVAEEALGTAALDQDAGVREAALHGLKIYGRDPEHVLE